MDTLVYFKLTGTLVYCEEAHKRYWMVQSPYVQTIATVYKSVMQH
jgi:hypothetical protein